MNKDAKSKARSPSSGYNFRTVLFAGAMLVLNGFALSWIIQHMNQADSTANLKGLVAGIVCLALCAYWVPRLWKRINVGLGLRSLLAVMVLGLSGASLSGCTTIGPGHVGIKINMNGDNRGVDEIPVTTGWVWYMPLTQQVFEYPTFVQTAVWSRSVTEGSATNEEISFNSKEGLLISGDVSLSYQLDPKKIPHFYVQFRSDDLETFTHGYLHNVARDAFNEVASTYAVEEIYGEKKAEFLNKVRALITSQVESVGVSISQFGFVGAPRIPDNVMTAINAKIAATQLAQQREYELKQTEAEAAKAVAQAEGEAKARIAQAEGEAKANELLTQSLTPALIQWTAIQKWDGHRPTVEGQGSGLILQVGSPSK